MNRFLVITVGVFLALATSARAQEGLQIDSLFSGAFVPEAKVTESVVSGKELKPYNLDYFRSIRFQATDPEIARIAAWIEVDALSASSKEMDHEDGEVTYALLSYPDVKNKHKYIGFQVKEAAGQRFVTVVYLTGKATTSDLRVIFKHR